MSGLIIASTFADANEGYAHALGTAVHNLFPPGGVIRAAAVSVTGYTHPSMKDRLHTLRSRGIHMIEEHPSELSADPIENNHLLALKKAYELAQETDAEGILYIDFDRLLRGGYNDSEVMQAMIRRVGRRLAKASRDGNGLFINMLRREEDYRTHHPALYDTETIANEVYANAFSLLNGRETPIDTGSTADAMTTEVAGEVLLRSRGLTPISFPPSAKWPIIAAGIPNVDVESQRAPTGALPYETAEENRRSTQHEADAFYRDYNDLRVEFQERQRQTLDSPAQWDSRIGLARGFVDFIDKNSGLLVRGNAGIQGQIHESANAGRIKLDSLHRRHVEGHTSGPERR